MDQIKLYNKIAKKFGKYSSGSKKTYKFITSDPEEIFLDILLSKINKNSRILDIGCADGRFSLRVAPFVKEIIGIDLSRGMLKIARKKQKEIKIKNAKFLYANNNRARFKENYFDLIYSRRGPTINKKTNYLKNNGIYLEIRVGNKDTYDLQRIFKRGQFYHKKKNTKQEIKKYFRKSLFKIRFLKEYYYYEIYRDKSQLNLMLQGSPIISDYNEKRDHKLLEQFCHRFKRENGIYLKRHRIVYWAKKA